jgi:hypothetical protein
LIPSRQFVEEGFFKKITLKKKAFKGAIFAFNDIIIVTKIKKGSKREASKFEVQTKIPLAGCVVKAIGSGMSTCCGSCCEFRVATESSVLENHRSILYQRPS